MPGHVAAACGTCRPDTSLLHYTYLDLQDIVSGWPNELFEPYAAYVYNVFQSQNEAPVWFEPFLHSAQRRWQRWVVTSVAACLPEEAPKFLGMDNCLVVLQGCCCCHHACTVDVGLHS
jgi:hypothetical protein